MFSKVAEPVYIPTSNVWRFQFLYVFANLLLSVFLITAMLIVMMQYLTDLHFPGD